MKFVLVLVEGQTEETFIRDVLNPSLRLNEIEMTPTIVTTKRVKNGPDFKGGISNYDKVKKEVYLLLRNTHVVSVTTMIDFYGLPNDFPGKTSIPELDCYSRVNYLEEKFSEDISHPKFLPFLTLHEFESLLFVSPPQISTAFPGDNSESDLTQIRNDFASPEEINDGRDTHPSVRIKNILPSFRKMLHGPLITKRIGLQQMREECRHFNDWIFKLESL